MSGNLTWREQHLYGSSRLGIWRIDTVPTAVDLWKISNYANRRQYELSNHLGNVMGVIGDYVTIVNDTTRYPSVFSLNDYYVFGATKHWSGSEGYRYGFNGKENDNEIKGEGNSLDFGGRIHDPRLGRFLSLDPLSRKYPGESNYAFVSNNPMIYVDPDGKDRIEYHYKIRKDGKVELRISTEKGVYKSLLHDTFDGSFYFTKHDYKVVTIEDHRSGKALTKSWEEMIYSPSEEIGFGEYMSIKTTGKSGISDMFKLPQIMVLGSGTYDLGWGKADPNRAIYTIDLNDPMVKDLFMLTDLLGGPDLKGANPERVTEMINQGVDILKSKQEQKRTAYCLSCHGVFESNENEWVESKNKTTNDTIKAHALQKVNETPIINKKKEDEQ